MARLKSALRSGVLPAVGLAVAVGLRALSLAPSVQAWLDEAANALTALLRLAGLVVVVTSFGLLLYWALRREKGTTILPFDVASDLNLVGLALSDSLVAALQRICLVHARRAPRAIQMVDVQTEQLTMPMVAPSQEDLKSAVADLGTMTVGVTELSLGKLLLVLKLLRRDRAAPAPLLGVAAPLSRGGHASTLSDETSERGGRSSGRLSGTLRRPPSSEYHQRRPLLIPPRSLDPYPVVPSTNLTAGACASKVGPIATTDRSADRARASSCWSDPVDG